MPWAASVPRQPAHRLREDVGARLAPAESAVDGHDQRHGRIEVRARDGPSARIRTTRMAPVGMVLPSSAMATLPPASFSAMMPEPTTVATRSPVPSASAAMRRAAVPSRMVQSPRPGNGSSSAVEPSIRPMSRKRCPNDI